MRQQPTPTADDDDSNIHQHDHEDICRHDHEHHGILRHRHGHSDDQSISISSTSKQAEQTVAPFLAEHIPMQYNPVGGPSRSAQPQEAQETQLAPNSSKYCYKHRPDLKCRRQANEPSMDQLQNELASLSQSDQQAISHVWSLFSAAPAKHRNLMLQGVLAQCCFPQLSYVAASVRDLIKIDFIAALPAELSFKILCYLDTTSLCKASQVSQRWRTLADDDVVWHKMCEQHIDRKCTKCGWGLPLLERKRLRIEKREIQLRATGRGLNEWSPELTPQVDHTPVAPIEQAESSSARAGNKRPLDLGSLSPELTKRQCTQSVSAEQENSQDEDYFTAPRKRPWKDVYRDRFKVGTAWKYGRCSTKVFKGHTNGVMCLQFDENVLITGSYDTTAKVWDVESGEELRTLTGHTSGIRCLQFDDGKLMTGSLDGTVRLWDYKTGQCKRVFNAHTEGIISLNFNPSFMATGSMDKTIRVWNFKDSKQTFLLRGHTDWVNCVKIDEASRTLFSASDDLTVRLWDLDTKQCLKVFEGHVGQVQQLQLMPPEFELDHDSFHAGDKDDDTSSVGSSAHHHHDDPSSQPAPFWPNDPDRPAPPRYMFTGALDSTIRLWDIHQTQPHSHQQSHQQQQHHANDDTANAFIVLPTDPLTNSHQPRATGCVRTFFGHVEGIWALAADHLRLISGSEDRMMKVWDPRTGKCERTFTGHAGPVTCAWLSESRLASGSEDCEVRMLVFGDQL